MPAALLLVAGCTASPDSATEGLREVRSFAVGGGRILVAEVSSTALYRLEVARR